MRTWAIAAVVIAGMGLEAASVDAQSWLQKGKEYLNKAGEALPGQGALSEGEIGEGLKEALRVGTQTVVKQLGAADGFNADPDIHIPLPKALGQVRSVLRKVGMASMMDDVELKLNRAAEAATPKARTLFVDAIKAMTLEDVKGIYNGPEDAATRYFQQKMSAPLALEMKPIVDASLAEVGAIKAYDGVMSQYKSIPMVPDVKADLTNHVLTKGLAGIFHYVAKEEAAIRKDPLKQTTKILKRVFGAGG